MTGARGRFTARALGLELSLATPLLGVPAGRPEPADRTRPTTVDQIDRDVMTRRWPEGAGAAIGRSASSDGSTALTILAHPDHGYRLSLPAIGDFLVSTDGQHVLCCPEDGVPAQAWQRLLLDQVLPLTAALHGLEILHATAVVHGDQALLIAGPSGAGKSSIAAELIRSGYVLLSEDVTALELLNGEVRAHPGSAQLRLRPDAIAKMDTTEAPASISSVLGASAEKGFDAKETFVARREERSLPLAALVVLVRGEGAPLVRAISSPSVQHVLAHTFVTYLDDIETAMLHLELAQRISTHVPMLEARVDPSTSAAALASEIARQRLVSTGGR